MGPHHPPKPTHAGVMGRARRPTLGNVHLGTLTPVEDCHEQGFVTSAGRFVNRAEGRRLQDAAGVSSVAPGGYRGGLLYSEDLY